MDYSNKQWLFCFFLLSCLTFSGCSKQTNMVAAGPEPVISLNAFQVQPEKIVRKIELVGSLEGQQEVTLSSEVAAKVVAIHADLGDRVQKGQVLVELDAREFQFALDRQHASLAQALTQLGVTNETDRVPEVSQTSTVRRAAADLAEAKTNFERIKTLVSKGVVSPSVYDTAESRYQVSEANYTSAIEQVRTLMAQVENMRVQLALAQKKLSDCQVRAPFSGAVRLRSVEIGQSLGERAAVMSIASTNPLKLRASVPELWFPYVAAGASIDLTVDAYPDKFAGRVLRVSRSVDPQTRSFTIEASVDNSKERLRPGLFARALLTTSKVDAILRVPTSAVVSFFGVQKIFAIENNQIRERVVKLGDRVGDYIEITEGLQPGTWIATTELGRIRQGSMVQIRKEA
jgi:RND family efflux transporter MFP subunit